MRNSVSVVSSAFSSMLSYELVKSLKTKRKARFCGFSMLDVFVFPLKCHTRGQ